ncbi:transcription antitermination factor NusB [Deinococcus roseus]|uniref:Transcription antitermination protein NusB n=1 Tax=Deinococcus roseus TaxID=392414 RepID=A0ABQ2CYG3_9DEIO|nr:transcription antitermination factor NusB [Deinococcus roseus]GGJ32962.1 N utilization substance protein B [Deinococcus roseus]
MSDQTRRQKNQPTGSRRNSREFAFRVIFEAQQGKQEMQDTFSRVLAASRQGDTEVYPELTPQAEQFAEDLALTYDRNQDGVDQALKMSITGWTFSQMPQTDVNVLRIAATEMMFFQTDAPVVIESAIRMARRFGSDESGRFVNSVLDKLARGLQDGSIPRPVKLQAGDQGHEEDPEEIPEEILEELPEDLPTEDETQ